VESRAISDTLSSSDQFTRVIDVASNHDVARKYCQKVLVDYKPFVSFVGL